MSFHFYISHSTSDACIYLLLDTSNRHLKLEDRKPYSLSTICLLPGFPTGQLMATHSSILAWRITGTDEPGGLLSMGLHRIWTWLKRLSSSSSSSKHLLLYATSFFLVHQQILLTPASKQIQNLTVYLHLACCPMVCPRELAVASRLFSLLHSCALPSILHAGHILPTSALLFTQCQYTGWNQAVPATLFCILCWTLYLLFSLPTDILSGHSLAVYSKATSWKTFWTTNLSLYPSFSIFLHSTYYSPT